jgi:hypothetical protein
VGTQIGPTTATQGVVFDVATKNLVRVATPFSELLGVAMATGGSLIAGDYNVVNPDIVQSFTHNICLTDGFYGLAPVAFPIQNWTWCTGIDPNGNVVGTQYTLLVVSGAVDPPTSGFTQATQVAFLNGTILRQGSRALAISGNEQVGDMGADISPGTFGPGSTAMLWHGTPQSFVQLGTTCDAQLFLAHGGCDSSSALATNGSQQGGFSTIGLSGQHATIWSGTAASRLDMHPALFSSSRVTGMSTIFQAGDGWIGGQQGAPGATRHGLLWQGSAASVVDLSPILPPDYPYVTITGADADGEVVGYLEKDLNGAPDPTSGVGLVLTPNPSMSVASLALTPSGAAPGDTVTATVTLRAPAATGGVWVNFTSSDGTLVPSPASVLVPESQISASVNVATPANVFLTSPETVTLTAIAGFTGRTAAMTVTPQTPADPIVTVTIPSARFHSGGVATGQVTLSAPAPAGGVIVSFNTLGMTVNFGPYNPICGCNGPSVTTYNALPNGLITNPGSIIVPAGQTSAPFSIAVGNALLVYQVAVQAATGNVMKQAVLNVGPPTQITVLSFEDTFALPTSAPFAGGTSGNLFGVSTNVIADAPLTVTFTSTNPAIVMPASILINTGNAGVTNTFSTFPVPVLTTGIVTATANGVSVSAPVSVAASPQPLLVGVTIPFVSSGQPFTGTVNLSGAALLGGATITLTSDTPAVAAVPASIVIPFGATSATFTGIAGPVAGPVTVTITAAFNGASVTGALPVLPGPVLSITGYTLSPYNMIGPGVVTTVLSP